MQEKNFDVHMPFVDLLGFRLLEKRDGTAKVAYDPKPEHFNSWKAIHGGAVMRCSTALSSACRALTNASAA
jgi:acyl-coenzyme A thioesterase PaaI-like protein